MGRERKRSERASSLYIQNSTVYNDFSIIIRTIRSVVVLICFTWVKVKVDDFEGKL